MKKQTVKKHIFLSGVKMVFVTLVLVLGINLVFAKIYTETIEMEVKASLERIASEAVLHNLLEEYTIRKNEFILLAVLDVILCVTVWILVSRFFTRQLEQHVMEPLNVLSEGTEKIRNKDLTCEIFYEGDREFEDVCQSFDEMRLALLAQQEKNQAYERARTDMIAGISHDLRTPLTAVRGTIKGLLDGVASTPDKQTRFLETAYRRTGEMEGLLEQLFYLSKLQTGNMPVHLQKVDLQRFVRGYIKEKGQLPENGNIEMRFETPGKVETRQLDPEHLCRIFDNLFENSRKYAKKEEVIITIALCESENDWQIRFADNGVGIAEEKLAYVFDEFYRADESRNVKKGSGLGLYIVKQLAEAMGGTVRAENKDGFTVVMEWKKEGGKDGGNKACVDRGR